MIDPHARLMGETSCLSKRDGKLVCHAKDPISSGLAIDGFLPPDHFAKTGAEVLSMGAGGSTIALTWHLMRRERGADVPSRIVVTDRSQPRLDEIRRIHSSDRHPTCRSTTCWPTSSNRTTRALASLKPHSLVINATGLGKDAPGSPITDKRRFPRRRRRLGPQLSRRSRLPRTSQAPAGGAPAADRRRLDLFPAWLDAGHRRGVPHRDRDRRTAVRRDFAHRHRSRTRLSRGEDPRHAPFFDRRAAA